jgi:hypothetical protein
MALYRWIVSVTSSSSVRVGAFCVFGMWLVSNRARLAFIFARLRRILLWSGQPSLR